jgi:acetate kinase
MRVLAVNAGSSSLKCSLFDMPARACLATGSVERLGEAESTLTLTLGPRTETGPCAAATHGQAFEALLAGMEGVGPVGAVGHRVVHGGSLTESVHLTDSVKAVIEAYSWLAPLHNPYNLAGVLAAEEALPGVPHIAVFDTAFHSTLPPRAFMYALPYRLLEDLGIRAYGFHGISCRYVTNRAAELLGRPVEAVNLVILHLGNGCSATAVSGGRSVDTSMGVTPLQGLPMGTRCGDIDPALPFLLCRRLGLSVEEVDGLLNRESGLKGLSGLSNDMRDLEAAARSGDGRAELALEVFAYRIRKYIGAYRAVIGRTDAVVFTAGIGENSAEVRRRVCAGLAESGIVLDEGLNARAAGVEGPVSSPQSPVSVLVVPTKEDLQIAIETHSILCEGPD